MEEELNENELEERFYSMLHYGDETQANSNTNQDALKVVENAPQSTLRRYWRTSGENTPQNTIINPYQKVNTANQKVNTPKEIPNKNTNKTKPKEEKRDSPAEPLPAHLAVFQCPIPQNVKKTIEIIENDDDRHVVELESSDEDEVIEVALPPKPTITIESSDEDEVTVQVTPTKPIAKPLQEKPSSHRDRDVSASPVPSVVSSVSDEFIRGDCIALNISSRHPDDHSFDFSLHGADLLGQSTPSKRKKKKKNKESATSTPVVVASSEKSATKNTEECFATPKSKAKNKRQRTKSYSVSEKSVPNADVYDSDSNQSFIEPNKKNQPYKVTEKSFPNADVYESDSNQSEIVKEKDKPKQNQQNINVESSDRNISVDIMENIPIKSANRSIQQNNTTAIVDLTDSSLLESEEIQENIVIGNVTGFTESEDYGEEPVSQNDIPKFGSTRVPAILYENLDFDNLKGKNKVCKNRRYSLTTLRAEMEKFYNESWGGEDFNHREIQKNMSRDKSLWAIDPKDRMTSSMSRKKVTCNYCNRAGHRDDTCRLKPPVCYMCGITGHIEPRCPSKICVNCGSPNHMYSTMCRNCSMWHRITCAECGQLGHPASHCPDLWRRYHNTIDVTPHLEENRYTKKYYQMYCSGCTRQGHLVHTCRVSLPFSGLPINSPYVYWYEPLIIDSQMNANNQKNKQQYKTSAQDSTISSATLARNDRNKRLSKSPTTHESHSNKKRNTSGSDMDPPRNTKSPVNPQKKLTQSKGPEDTNKTAKEPEKTITGNVPESIDPEKAPDFIPIGSANRDKKGQMIQDNEVSDTSAVVTSARIYITNDIIDKLKSSEGQEWLKQTTAKHNVTVENSEINSFLSIKGKLGDQEAFQTALRDWTKSKPNENSKSDNKADVQETNSSQSPNIPKNRNNVLRKLNRALDSLKEDLGEPNSIYKELNYLQARHMQLLNQKVINPTQLSNNRDNINEMLKKLNMVLLGQAGLAGGSKHINELYSLQEKIISLRQKNISAELRKEIGRHYHCIFTAVPRNDYSELIKSYYGLKPTQIVFKKKKEKSIRLSPKKKKFNTIPLQQKAPGREGKVGGNIVETMVPIVRKPLVEKTMNKLVFYHKRLVHARPIDTILKKTRIELVRKLHSHMASLGKNANTSSKALKKIKKTQAQCQLFLNNV